MLKPRKEFLVGLLAASIGFTSLFNISNIQAAKKYKQTPEIKFARQLNLFDSYSYSSRTMRNSISRVVFNRCLKRTLMELGVVNEANYSSFNSFGIVKTTKLFEKITRKEVAEDIFRTLIYLWDNDHLPHPKLVEQKQPFRDYKISSKYAEAFAFTQKAGIIKGMPNGKFYPNKAISLKESLYILKRTYDAINLKPGQKPIKKELRFKDVPLDHWMTKPIGNLEKAGAFNFTSLGKKLNGNRKIKVDDFTKIMLGIFSKSNKPAYKSEVKYLRAKFGKNRNLTRSMLARYLSSFVQAFPMEKKNSYKLYSDVRKGTGLSQALRFLSEAGIRMGYPNGKFAGHERVSRFEALGVLNVALKQAQKPTKKVRKSFRQKTATRKDITALKNLIRMKQQRIKRLLGR